MRDMVSALIWRQTSHQNPVQSGVQSTVCVLSNSSSAACKHPPRRQRWSGLRMFFPRFKSVVEHFPKRPGPVQRGAMANQSASARTRRNKGRGLWILVMTVFSGLTLPVNAASAESLLAVDVSNLSEPVLCAEKDNVALMLSDAGQEQSVRSFAIQAVHPAYIGMIAVDSDAPDFTSCDMSQDPVFASGGPAQHTIYESPDLWITGFTFESFWRPASVPVHVQSDDGSGKVNTFEGLHMLQVWVRDGVRPEEVLVLYPPDGYWRARPLSYAQMRWTAYGSSFLVGPVQDKGRPVAVLESVTFDPKTRTFAMAFAAGGAGSLSMAQLDRQHFRMDVELQGVDTSVPFAALRSMYVTRTNADVSEIAWRAPHSAGWQESPVMAFQGGRAVELWAGRSVPSRHNLSAPDMIFGPFHGDGRFTR
ncbi:hypothetical protein DBV39_18935 [Orrella marina]|uniref:Uncharacterized protein n=2 Tax=Orrella marina TaxID=2163011 RepID=A0A2R4XNU3_9BURK|nr:hypothetical protein DBV39_18935 [Orrella marina]